MEIADHNFALLDTLPMGVFVLKNDGNVLYWNRILERWTGIPRESIVERPVTEFFPEIQDPRVAGRIRDVFSLGAPAVFSSKLHAHILPITLPRGAPQVQNVTVTALHTAEGNLALFAIDDVTDLTSRIANFRKLRDMALQEVEERKKAQHGLTLANKKLNLLSSITRHDILNQLTVLLGYMDITREMVSDPKTLEYLTIQENAAKNIRRQIEFTRDYEDLGVQSPRWHRVSPVLRMAAGSLPMGEVALEDNAGSLQVYADPLFEKVFYNLVDNSLRYGEKISRIKVHYAESPGGLLLIFEDNGVGIPSELKKKIFKRGFGKNTGLGLFLIREILDITGISIEENGEPGEGARFAILIPTGVYRFANPGTE